MSDAGNQVLGEAVYLLGSDYKNIIFIWRKQMKVSVIRSSSDEEDEIIFRCHTLSDDMDRLIHRLRFYRM